MQQKIINKRSILNQQAILHSLQFTPISTFLSLFSVIISFVVSPTTPLPFILLLAPLYINSHGFVLGITLIGSAVIWPNNISIDSDLVVRLLLIINALYMMGSSNRIERFRVLPSIVPNQGIPILI